MRELPLALLRFGILALLWLFVLSAVRVIRSDLRARPSEAAPPAAPNPPRQQAAAPSPSPGPRQMQSQARQLVVTSGPLTGTTVGLNNVPITFGRLESCTLVLGDDYISNEHARLSPAGDHWVLEDLGSTNGTFLAEQQVTGPVPVALGAPIRLGRTVLELRR